MSHINEIFGLEGRVAVVTGAGGVIADVISRTPFGRFGKEEDLRGAVLFLASERASGFISGISVPVDGGFLADNI